MLTYRNLVLSEAKLISDLILSPFGTDYSLHHNYARIGFAIDYFRERITNFPLGLIGLIKNRKSKSDVLLGLAFGTRLDEIADTSGNNHFRNYDPKGKFFYIEGLITESGSTDLGIRKSLLNEIKKQAFFIDGIERVFVGINVELNNQIIVDSVGGIFIQEFEDYYPHNSITCNGLGKIVEFRKVKV